MLIKGLFMALLLPGFVQSPAAQTSAAGYAEIEALAPFPRTYRLTSGGQVTLYEPQVASWFSQARMVAWSAVSYEAKPGGEPAIGSIKIEAETEVALDDRLVRFKNFEIPEVSFPSLSKDDAARITVALKAELPPAGRVLALDNVLAAVDKSQLISNTKNVAGIKADPPIVFYSSKPAIMVAFDGDPIWSPIKDVDLKFAVNTNWDIFQQPSTKTYFLRSNTYWFRSSDIKTGWVPAGDLPESFSKLPASDNWKDVIVNIPGKRTSVDKMPMIFVSTVPAELIVSDGAPKYTPVGKTSLLWVSNTESDVFRNGAGGDFYYLVAGRWFSGPSLNGPWTFATTSLPADFQSIPLEHPRSRVLASVPGTQQATEAVLQASVPRVARVSKIQLKAPEVVYQGEPVFEPIQDTMLSRAVNTDKQIVRAGEMYYMCYEGIWFVSSSPKEYWTVASDIPDDVYNIPPSSPLHNVTYVTVSDEDPNDEWVTESYVAAYTGTMVGWGCAVWGTGWYYPPYVYYGGYYPIYYPYYGTYGYAAWYNPYLGTYGRGAVAYGPYGGVGFGAVYNPSTGTYARGATAYGPYGSTSFARAYNPRTGTYAQTRQGSNVYGNWGSSYVQRGDKWAQSGHVYNNATGRGAAGIKTSNGGGLVTAGGSNGRTTVGRTAGGDIYAGHDGNVYKKTDGGFQKYENGSWTNTAGNGALKSKAGEAQRPNVRAEGSQVNTSTLNQLNRDAGNRAEGIQRANDLGNYRSNMGGRSSAGSFRGGGFRGGGGRRR